MTRIILLILMHVIVALSLAAQGRSVGVFVESSQIEGDSMRLVVRNATPDTLYLFSTYLAEPGARTAVRSKLLRRYDKQSHQFRLSFVPLPGLVHGVPQCGSSDPDYCIARGMDYDFVTLVPEGSATVSVPAWVLRRTDYIDDFNPKAMTTAEFNLGLIDKLDRLRRNIVTRRADCFVIELAVFPYHIRMPYGPGFNYDYLRTHPFDYLTVHHPVRLEPKR